MRIMIQDKVSHNFIEGPVANPQKDSNTQDETAEIPNNIVNPTSENVSKSDPNDTEDQDEYSNERYD